LRVEHEDGVVSDALYEKAKPVAVFWGLGTSGDIRQAIGKDLDEPFYLATDVPGAALVAAYRLVGAARFELATTCTPWSLARSSARSNSLQLAKNLSQFQGFA
jgi:hypothetical protein